MGGTGVGRLRRAVGADDVHHHEALTGADQQVDAAALRFRHLHCTFNGVVQHIGKKGVEVAGLKKVQTAAVRHRIELDAAGFAEQRFFGEHHVQHALDGAGQFCDIVSGKNAEKEHRRAADERDAQAVP